MIKPLKNAAGKDGEEAKTSRFEMRMSPYVRKVVKRAAEIQGRSMGDRHHARWRGSGLGDDLRCREAFD
jgi:hypothetical protein